MNPISSPYSQGPAKHQEPPSHPHSRRGSLQRSRRIWCFLRILRQGPKWQGQTSKVTPKGLRQLPRPWTPTQRQGERKVLKTTGVERGTSFSVQFPCWWDFRGGSNFDLGFDLILFCCWCIFVVYYLMIYRHFPFWYILITLFSRVHKVVMFFHNHNKYQTSLICILYFSIIFFCLCSVIKMIILSLSFSPRPWMKTHSVNSELATTTTTTTAPRTASMVRRLSVTSLSFVNRVVSAIHCLNLYCHLALQAIVDIMEYNGSGFSVM